MPHEMQCAFGFDLAGFSGAKTRLARAVRTDDGSIQVTIYKGKGTRHIHKLGDPLSDLASGWPAIIKACLRHGHLVVDAPIDLQGLPEASSARFAWQLSHRPIDFALGALPPLSSWMGFLVATFRFFVGTDYDRLGESLFETYPAASLKIASESQKIKTPLHYKKQKASWQKDRWFPAGDESCLTRLLEVLQVRSSSEIELDDDDFDALICAVTGLRPPEYRSSDDLSPYVTEMLTRKKLSQKDAQHFGKLIPKGYCLLSAPPSRPIHVHIEEVERVDALLQSVTCLP